MQLVVTTIQTLDTKIIRNLCVMLKVLLILASRLVYLFASNNNWTKKRIKYSAKSVKIMAEYYL